MSHILIVEDEAVIRGALRKLLERHDHSVDEAPDVASAQQYTLTEYDLIISDLRLPDKPGTDLIGLASPTPVMIMTSFASLKSAVDAMRDGAVDYIPKPFDHQEMVMAVERIIKERRLSRGNRLLRQDLETSYPVSNLIGDCPPMVDLKQRIQRAAPLDTSVLILGEAGSGKELVARALHEHSHRSDNPFVAIHCASTPKALQLTELFGDTNHAGKIEQADGGTVFFDEVADLSSEVQNRLLTLLTRQEILREGAMTPRRVDVRVLASSQARLSDRVRQGAFRDDLFFRLNVIELNVPPLRDRGEDLRLLATSQLLRISSKMNAPHLTFSSDALQALQNHDWPGNVRELNNIIERAVILCDEQEIGPAHLGLSINRPPQRVSRASLDPSEDLSLEDYFTRFVLENQDSMTETQLAQKLGISRKSLWERRQRLGIPRKKSRNSEKN